LAGDYPRARIENLRFVPLGGLSAISLVGEVSVSEDLVIQISQLLKTSIAKLATNEGEIANGNETLNSAELVSWTVMTLLDLIKEKSNQPNFAKTR